MTRKAEGAGAPPPLGIVEGYFGEPWSWDARRATMEALAPAGYRFFHYAPKGDAFLRRQWDVPYPDDELAKIAAFAATCRAAHVTFGIGLTPFEAHRDVSPAVLSALKAKVRQLDEVGIDTLVLLFDDMEGAELPDLAARQRRLVDTAASETRAGGVAICPSYYSDDPVLDRVFGRRPAGYLADLARLDRRIDFYWTGEEVCAREFTPGGLAHTAEVIGRKPLLWDNYPVNDGHRMCERLHLRGFTGRPAAIGRAIAGHAINPALQPVLTCIPALTLAESYRLGADYRYGAAFARAAAAVAGEEIGAMLVADLLLFQDVGLAGMGTVDKARARYAAFDHPAAREVVAWLDGHYRVSADMVKTQ